jgi:hypothetical protein
VRYNAVIVVFPDVLSFLGHANLTAAQRADLLSVRPSLRNLVTDKII